MKIKAVLSEPLPAGSHADLGDFKQLNGLFSFGFPWVMLWYGRV